MKKLIQKNEFVSDTMAIILFIENRKMGKHAGNIFDRALKEDVIIYIPGMVFPEVFYLHEKNRIEASLNDAKSLIKENKNIKEHPINLKTSQAALEINDIPDLHDRLIAGAAKLLKLPLITNDPIIQASTFLETIW